MRDGAKELLVHYMRMLAHNSGMAWDDDNTSEVEDIVDLIIDAAIEAAAEEGASRALRALPTSVQE